jgi:hypothetical protein
VPAVHDRPVSASYSTLAMAYKSASRTPAPPPRSVTTWAFPAAAEPCPSGWRRETAAPLRWPRARRGSVASPRDRRAGRGAVVARAFPAASSCENESNDCKAAPALAGAAHVYSLDHRYSTVMAIFIPNVWWGVQ